MSAVEQLSEDLDLLSQRVWNIWLDDNWFRTFTQKVSRLSAQLEVQHVLQNTVQHLIRQQSVSGLPNTQTRVSGFFKNAYGKPDNPSKNEQRWQRLRGLDCEAFLLIAVSYTPLDISKMGRIEFDYLVENAANFLQVKALPPKWIFYKDIQLGIVVNVELQEATKFRKRYHTLEFAPNVSQGGEPTGNPSEQPSPSSPRTIGQLIDSDSQHSDAGVVVQYQILDVERPEKRRRVAITPQGQEATQLAYQVILPQPSSNTTQDEQEKPAVANSLSPDNENREMKYMFNNALASNISRMPEPFRSAIQNSRLWNWERGQGLLTTGCWPSLFPKDYTQDVSFTIWCGHDDGYQLNEIFGSELAISS